MGRDELIISIVTSRTQCKKKKKKINFDILMFN